MTYRTSSVLAVIPARGGSKGIPRKNLKIIGGRSLVEWCSIVAKDCPFVDACVLSTDDDEIAAEGRKHGIAVPFVRPAELASDTARAAPVWRHAWLESEKHWGRTFDISVLLEPTSPLRRPSDIEAVILKLIDGGHRSAASASRTPSHHSPEKQLVLNEKGQLCFVAADGVRFTVRQNIPAYHHRNGLCYAAIRSTVVERCQIFEEDCGGVITTRNVIDINDPLDLEFAALLMRRDDYTSPRMLAEG